MKKDRFEQDYNISVSSLKWKTGWNNLFEVAEVGKFAVYHEFDPDTYYVTLDNSVYGWRVDLSRYAKGV
jgi:hypothetical protein